MKKHVILFLAANPRGSDPLTLGQECAEIQRELKLAPHRDDFHFESRWAVGIDELMRHLTELDPVVIHFSGHGGGESGLMLQDEQGEPQPVSARALAMIVGTTARNVRVMVLNACFSAVQAEALRAKVDCIVGMDGAIEDIAARAFAIRFYGALGNRRSIGNAVEQGIAALAARQLPDEVLPRCLTRDGIDAHQVVLDPAPERSAPERRSPRPVRAPGFGARRELRSVLPNRSHLRGVHRRERPEVDAPPSVPELVRSLHVRLLAGYAPDAVICAAAIAEAALRSLAGMPAESAAGLGELIDALRGKGETGYLGDADWLEQRRVVATGFVGQVCGELDGDGRRAGDIATRLAIAAGLLTEAESSDCRHSAGWPASEPASSALLRLDRATHRKAVDDLLEQPRRVVVALVHGEIDQGHDHFGEILTWRLRSAPNTRWCEVTVAWPPPSPSLGTRLASLFEELAYGFGVQLSAPAEDPATPEGARRWTPVLAPVLAAINARRERLLVRHVLRRLGTGPGGDDALVDAYVRAIWASLAVRPGARVVVGLNLRRIERGGIVMSKAWRMSRAELAAARAIAAVLDRLDMPHGGLCKTLPELTSVPASDLVDWLLTEGDRKRSAAEVEAGELVSSTRGGRFDLVVERLAALNLDRHRNPK